MSVQLNWQRRFRLCVGHRGWTFLVLICLAPAAAAFEVFGLGGSDGADTPSVTVEDPYIDMHTGPGREIGRAHV